MPLSPPRVPKASAICWKSAVACSALGHLGSHAALPVLVEALEREQADVKRAAWHALKRITGRTYGPEPEIWRRLALGTLGDKS